MEFKAIFRDYFRYRGCNARRQDGLDKKEKRRWSVPEDEVFRAVLKEHLECIGKRDRKRYEQLVKQIQETGGNAFFKE
ncbi:hypothetical protein Ngar_c06590 [Candidatus Nitrososphaera gargensis Ga9.2]|uniref:Uncharacterized protein n=1 Tax=Nitrososphaera gargensis (strain Ga9.2) TaxID=1237085 RepID=K0II10_NITGG|nr:hypothetical protein Ngar_c06590 [Candidatus Nitrososphaera gargensis Ga9.2]